MHINDREALLGKPGSRATPYNLPLTWHDHRDPRLTKAFAELRRRCDVANKARNRKPFWYRWYVLGPLGLFVGITATQGYYVLLPVGLAAVVLTLVFLDVVWPVLALSRFVVLAVGIRRGDFGAAAMFSIDPAWKLLDEALTEYGHSLPWLFSDQQRKLAATSLIARYLRDYSVQRGILRVSFNPTRLPAYAELSAGATATAADIVGKLRRLGLHN